MSTRQDSLAEQTPSVESLVAEVADEFLEALHDGRQPDAEDYACRYPQIAAVLRKVLPALDLLRRSAPEDAPSQPGEISDDSGRLGDFRILGEIGRGGMGIVYEAEQISLDRRVALKVLPFAAVLDPKQLQRFKNEARAAASLDHPHIVSVYSVGCERAVHFYAMQYIEGQTLAEVISQGSAVRDQGSGVATSVATPSPAGSGEGPEERVTGRQGDKVTMPTASHSPPHPVTPSPPQAAETHPLAALSTEGSTRDPEFFRTVAHLGIQAAEALEHAHQMGVVHRDIKPSNLMVESRLHSPSGRGAGGEGPHLWITDFGLAMTHTETNLTMTGDLLGTLRYMSPEQVQAKHGVLDHRTDVYSLGLTLYELLTLQPAFPGDDRQKLLRQVAEDDPRPPRQLNSAIPKDLETIILKATAKEPEDRYVTAQQLADDLRRFLEDRPIQARRPSLPSLAAKWSYRHRRGVATAIIAAFATLLLSLGLIWHGAQREARQRQRAEKNLQLALRAVDRVYLKYAHDNYLDIGGINRRRISPDVEAFLTEAIYFYEQFAQANRDDLSVRLETVKAWDRVGRVRSSLGMHDEAEAACRQAIRIAEELHSESPDMRQYRDLLRRVHYNRAAAFVENKRFNDAISDYREAIQLDSRFAWAFHNRGSAYAEKGDLDKAVDDYTQAIRLDPKACYAYHARGRVYLKKRQFAQAVEDFNRALKRAPTGDDLSAVLTRGQLYSDVAWLLATCPHAPLRDPHRAVQLATDAVKLRPYWMQTLGVARYRAGDFTGSIEALEKSTTDACSWSFLAMAHWQLDKKQEARQWYDKAVERLANLAKPPDARDPKMRLAPGKNLGPEPFRRFVAEAAELLGLEPRAASGPETTEDEPQEFVDHMIFPWSAWQDPLW